MKPTPVPSTPNRRGFLNWLLGTTLGGFFVSIVYPAARYIVPPPVVEAITNSVTLDLDEAAVASNSGQIFKFGQDPGILIRTPAGELRAFTAICTHLDCTVQYRDDLRHIWCACHNGHYDLHGTNIAGPPPRPLEEYSVQVMDGKIYVSKEV